MKKITKYNYDRIDNFNWSKWINRKLNAEDKINLSKQLKLVTNGNIGRWQTVKKYLWFFQLESKDIIERNKITNMTERFTIISIMENAPNEEFDII
ncbi:MAG: hypothetical protein ACRC57_00480 [Sarcina sp.]